METDSRPVGGGNSLVTLCAAIFFFALLAEEEMMMDLAQTAVSGQPAEDLTELGKCILKHEVRVHLLTTPRPTPPQPAQERTPQTLGQNNCTTLDECLKCILASAPLVSTTENARLPLLCRRAKGIFLKMRTSLCCDADFSGQLKEGVVSLDHTTCVTASSGDLQPVFSF